jgi:hypothetical protein
VPPTSWGFCFFQADMAMDQYLWKPYKYQRFRGMKIL